jgi:hypothetical protein
MLYGAETWTLGIHQTNKSLTIEIDLRRRTARKSWKEKIGNLKIGETINVQHNIVEIIEETTEIVWKFEEDEK